jgi:hypothetical protein
MRALAIAAATLAVAAGAAAAKPRTSGPAAQVAARVKRALHAGDARALAATFAVPLDYQGLRHDAEDPRCMTFGVNGTIAKRAELVPFARCVLEMQLVGSYPVIGHAASLVVDGTLATNAIHIVVPAGTSAATRIVFDVPQTVEL